MNDSSRVERFLLFSALAFALLLILAFGSGQFVKTYRNATGSMEPTLPTGSNMVVRRTKDVHRGDIIAFHYPLGPTTAYVKRIVAEPGETVQIVDKKLFVNGREQHEPYVMHDDATTFPALPSLPEPYRSRDQFGPFRVPADSFFVLGDNRDRSSDSRYWGSVPRELVIGRATYLYSLRGFRKIGS